MLSGCVKKDDRLMRLSPQLPAEQRACVESRYGCDTLRRLRGSMRLRFVIRTMLVLHLLSPLAHPAATLASEARAETPLQTTQTGTSAGTSDLERAKFEFEKDLENRKLELERRKVYLT